MFPNVRAEMARQNMTLKMLAENLEITLSTLSGKLSGKYPVTLNEAKTIKKVLNVDLPLEVLFETEGSK